MRRFEKQIAAAVLLVALLCYLASFVIVSAHGETNGVTVQPEVPLKSSNGPYPTTQEDIWKMGIAVLTPVIVWGVSFIPKIPSPVLPAITPFVGILIGLGLKQLGSLHLSWVDMGQAGALGVFVRELVNQWVTQQVQKARAANISFTNTPPANSASPPPPKS
jgi:hypothetical protein